MALYSIKIGGGAFERCDKSDAWIGSLAEKSGGENFGWGQKTSLQSVLKKVIASLRYTYTPGFYPSDTGETGSYHELDVRLRDRERFPPCRVASRKGYYAGVSALLPEKQDEPTTAKAPWENADQSLIQQAIATAGTIPIDIPDIAITLTTEKIEELNGQSQLALYLKIDPAGVRFNRMDDAYIGTQWITVFYADREGKILGSEWKKLEHRLSQEQYDRVRKEGIRRKTTIPTNKAQRILNVVVYDAILNQIGSKIVTLP